MRDNAIVVAVVVALAARLLFFVFINPLAWDDEAFNSHSFYDAKEYSNITKNMLKDLEGGPLNPFIAFKYTHRTPAYPSFLAVFYLAFGEKAWPVFIAHILIDTATTVLVYQMTRIFTSGEKIPLAAALFYALDPLAIYYTCTLMAETTFVFLVTAAVYTLLSTYERGWAAPRLIIAAFTLGLATLVRYIGIFLPLALIPCFVGIRGISRPSLRGTAAIVTLFLLAYAAALAPWQYRNYAVHGHYALGIFLGFHMCKYNAAHLVYLNMSVNQDSTNYLSMCESYKSNNPFIKADKQLERATGVILGNPVGYLTLHVKGIYDLFIKRGANSPHRVWTIYHDVFDAYGIKKPYFFLGFATSLHILTVIENALLLLGLGRLLSRRHPTKAGLFLICPLVYFANATSIYASGQRLDKYILPLLPFIAVLAAIGLSWVVEKAYWALGRVTKKPV